MDKKTISLSSLKARGWTKPMIDELLPKPTIVPNPYFKESTMRIWDLDTVLAVEKTSAFKEYSEKIENYDKLVNRPHNEIHISNPALDYPNARKTKRHFILNIGPTNTGKTHTALQAFKKAETGIYLAPLRLLAMEIQDRMLDEGVLCSMTTGEEENIISGATLMSSTVEKIDLSEHYQIGIIDECQMIADRDRGGSWTRAILGLNADIIYLCMSPDAEDICIQLIQMCGDTYEINYCERKVPLEYIGTVKPTQLKRHDAIILFSRRSVLNYAEELKSFGLKASVVYGALPYKSRKRQVEMYNNGETDVIVSTDAIGMGMNLPIKRVIFAEVTKFDGKQVRPLKSYEIKQIAGRAGRYGMFEKGEVGIISDFYGCPYIEDGLKEKDTMITKARIPFPDEIVSESDDKISNILKQWNKTRYPDLFNHQDTEFMMKKIKFLEQHYPILDKRTMIRFANVMFDEKKDILFDNWASYIDDCVNQMHSEIPIVDGKYLQDFESVYEQIDLFYSFHKSMNIPFNYNEVVSAKEDVIESINRLLIISSKTKKGKRKKCKICGRLLPQNSPFQYCRSCYQLMKY